MTYTKPFAFTIGLLAAMSLATGPTIAQTGDFCAGLKSVAAQTATGFASLRGAQIGVSAGTNGLTYTDYTYAATTVLAGANASSCQVITTVDSGTSHGVYRCFFGYGSGKRLDAMGTLADTISHCIGPVASTDDIDVYTDDDVGSISFVHPDYTVELNASDSEPLTLIVSKT